MKFEELQPIGRDELSLALEAGSPDDAAMALLRMSLNEESWEWAGRECARRLDDDRPEVRRAAIVGLGHLARIHRRRPPVPVLGKLNRLKETLPDLAGTVEDALDDIATFGDRGE